MKKPDSPLPIQIQTWVFPMPMAMLPFTNKCFSPLSLINFLPTLFLSFRTGYYTDYRQVYSMEYQTVYKCCPGWYQLSNDEGCLYRKSPGIWFISLLHSFSIISQNPLSQLCHCPPGFQGPRCQYDVNECEAENGGCESQCCNTIGSFYCKCPEGQKLRDDRKACEDVDECQVHNGGCQHRCVNTPSSYYCECQTGFRLHTDGRTCIVRNPCADRNGGCMHKCQARRGLAHCECHAGYQLAPDHKTCADVNECALGLAKCSHSCLNTRGSFKCVCNPGYELGSDSKQCYRIEMEIVNSCEANNGGCSHGCSHTSTGPLCTCHQGYELDLDQKTCIDIDDCAGSPCCAQACTNNPGGYECGCYAGYRLSTDGCGCDGEDALDGRQPFVRPIPHIAVLRDELTQLFEEEYEAGDEEEMEARGEHTLSEKFVCLDDTFGHDCSLTCDDCRNGGTCRLELDGCDCPEGWTGIICNQKMIAYKEFSQRGPRKAQCVQGSASAK
uniref:EGF like domain multiple 6 n=1 Tax=Monodelphis domestica TaxID=13616 RepID=A0A5F8HE18_MONDO